MTTLEVRLNLRRAVEGLARVFPGVKFKIAAELMSDRDERGPYRWIQWDLDASGPGALMTSELAESMELAAGLVGLVADTFGGGDDEIGISGTIDL